MHEWALAEAVMESVKEHAAGRNVLRVTVLFGELQQIDRGIFQAGLREMASDYALDPSVVCIEDETARFRCTPCGREWALSDLDDLDEDTAESVHFLPEAVHAWIRCPACGSADFVIAAGRGVSIGSIEVEDPR